MKKPCLGTIITLWWFFLGTKIIRYHGGLYITIYIQFKNKYIYFEGFWRWDRIFYHVFIMKYFVYLFICCTIFVYFSPFFLFSFFAIFLFLFLCKIVYCSKKLYRKVIYHPAWFSKCVECVVSLEIIWR